MLLAEADRDRLLLDEEMLAALGYEPAGFDGADRTLAAFRTDPGRFQIALLDDVLPEMTGIELSERLVRVRPDLPVILMTALVRSTDPVQLKRAGICDVLRKPVRSRDLADYLPRHLSAPAAPSPNP